MITSEKRCRRRTLQRNLLFLSFVLFFLCSINRPLFLVHFRARATFHAHAWGGREASGWAFLLMNVLRVHAPGSHTRCSSSRKAFWPLSTTDASFTPHLYPCPSLSVGNDKVTHFLCTLSCEHRGTRSDAKGTNRETCTCM